MGKNEMKYGIYFDGVNICKTQISVDPYLEEACCV